MEAPSTSQLQEIPNQPSTFALLSAVIEELKAKGLHAEGLFSKPTSVTDIRNLYTEICQEGMHKLKEQEGAHLMAGMIIWHLKMQDEPIVPFSLYDFVVSCGGKDAHDEGSHHNGGSKWGEEGKDESDCRMTPRHLRDIVAQLPQRNWRLLVLLLDFLAQVASVSDVNEMGPEALAQVFAPVLCRPQGTAFMSLRHVQDLIHIQRVVKYMIDKHTLVNNKEIRHSHPSQRQVTPRKEPQRRQSSIEIKVVQRLILDTVSLLFCELSDDEGDGDGDGGGDGRQGAGKIRSLLSSADGQVHRAQRLLSDDEEDEGLRLSSPTGLHFLSLEDSATRGLERRRMVEACRALRAQISQFEDAFVTEFGHLPKGRERAPLASTYAQYKQWKRLIRDDAATELQAFVRGAVCRIKYPLACRRSRGRGRGTQSNASPARKNLSLSPTSSLARAMQGANLQNKPNGHLSPTNTPGSTREGGVNSEMLEALLEEKKRVKAQLKKYDQEFQVKHGRLPSKLEKEPMRHMYDIYNGLKQQLSEAGLDGTGENRQSPTRNRHASELRPVSQLSAEVLKREKKSLHLVLKQYEKRFKEKHGREVSCPADIAPVEGEYQRYKEIKRRLTKLSK